jgi:isoleucyl-tRNA synthetase
VKDSTAVAMFGVKESSFGQVWKAFQVSENKIAPSILAWTTTPWTLSSNTALAIGNNIDYVLVQTFNAYSHEAALVVLAKDLLSKHFNEKAAELQLEDYKAGDKLIPFKVLGQCKGSDLVGIRYHQLLPYALPCENPEEAFRVIPGDFVTTSDGTGIVHIAPTFGADDMRVAREAGVPPMLVLNEQGKAVPLVDLRGKFRPEMQDPQFGLGGEFVKEDYLSENEKAEELAKQKELLKGIIADTSKLNYLSVDERIILKLQNEGKLFKKEKYEHNYPHCWRTDKPVLYYPLDSWFVKATAVKERMIALNKTINWKPEHTGTGRFGEWLNNLNDWNLSRSRYWGVPLPIWRSEDGEEKCIGSMEELQKACDEAVKAGVMKSNPLADFKAGDFSKANYDVFDLHRPYVDDVVLVSSKGNPMKREADLIDVWFDSGAMPYAQLHYPFENKELIDNKSYYPADFIAEGVDQTRGWFYTLHAISTLVFDSVAYKNVVSNGLVLDKNGQKMSKRLGNAVDPFDTLEKFGPDATRWYMITNAAPWENLKFDLEGITETQRKFFRALHNTYAFFSLYAKVDNFSYTEKEVPLENRPEIDRWILSRLNSLIKSVDQAYQEYEPTRAGREIEEFVLDHLSNWYVRLCRRRFWKGEYSEDKIAAYQTLYTCLETVALLSSPIAPFYADQLFNDLNSVTKRHATDSVHLANFPIAVENHIDTYLEEKMELAQKVSSMVLALRKKQDIKVRQPLQKIMLPVLDPKFKEQVDAVSELILSEVNVKQLEYLPEDSDILVKSIKPNFKTLGKKYGKHMKAISALVSTFGQKEIAGIERSGSYTFENESETITMDREDFEIASKDIPGWLVASEGRITVALDITISDELRQEGLAREVVNRIQTLRKERGLELTDKISIEIQRHDSLNHAIENNFSYICSETLAINLELVDSVNGNGVEVEVDDSITTRISIEKN